MIASAITHIAGQLDGHLRRSLGSTEEVVVVSNILEQDGTIATHINNRVVVFLVNVEKDTVAHRSANGDGRGSASRVVSFPPLYLNLYVMVAAHFGGANYGEALKVLSSAVTFFQGRPVLDHSNSPGLDPRIEKLVLDIENLNVHDLSNLWGVLSGRYLPSLLYKVRMVAIDSGDVRKTTPAVTTPETTGHPA